MVAGCCLLFISGCALDRSAYVRQDCGPGGTNICIVIIQPDGGETFLPMGDAVVSNLAKQAASAFEVSTGVGAASTAVSGAGKAVTAIEAAKAAKPNAAARGGSLATRKMTCSASAKASSTPPMPSSSQSSSHCWCG